MTSWISDIQRPSQQQSRQAQAFSWAMAMTIRPLAHIATRSPMTMLAIRKAFHLTRPILANTPANTHVAQVLNAQVRGEWVCAAEARSAQQVVLYLHGGAFFFGSARGHRQMTSRLSASLRRPVLAIDYRLAPRHSFEDWRDDALQAYKYLLERGYSADNILVAGDSAGGNLTLVLLQTLRDRKLPLPRAAICISPWTDLTDQSTVQHVNALRDPFMPLEALRPLIKYLVGTRSPYDPMISPAFGDFTGLPPLCILVGSTEILRSDARLVAMRAKSSGVSVDYSEWHRMPHVFPLFAQWLPEGRAAFKHMHHFVAGVEARSNDLAA